MSKKRVKAGRHGIPEKDIERRYYESFTNLKLILPLCNKVEIFNNSEKFQHLVSIYDGKINYLSNQIPNWCNSILNKELLQ